jgi:hypothetical protein
MNNFRNLVVALVLLAITVPGTASAAETQTKKTLNPWTDCGIGAMIFTNTGWAAAISNIIWDFGITAVTSNYSSQNTCGSSNAKVAMFIGTTYANLEDETAKGNGQHLHALLDMLSCDPASHQQIIRSVRSEFGQSISRADYNEKDTLAKAEGYYNLVQEKVSGEFSQQCHVL